MELRIKPQVRKELASKKKNEIIKRKVWNIPKKLPKFFCSAAAHSFCKMLYPIVGNLSANLQLKAEKIFGRKYFNAEEATLTSILSNSLISSGIVGYLQGERDGMAWGIGCGLITAIATLGGDLISRLVSSVAYSDSKLMKEGSVINASLPGKVVSIPLEIGLYSAQGVYNLSKRAISGLKSLEQKVEDEIAWEEKYLNRLQKRLSPQIYGEEIYEFLANAEKSDNEKDLRIAYNAYRRMRDFDSMERISKKLGYSYQMNTLRLKAGYLKGKKYLEEMTETIFSATDEKIGTEKNSQPIEIIAESVSQSGENNYKVKSIESTLQ